MGLRFTIIMHEFRKRYGLSMPEYALCDMIYHLSVNPNAPIKEWCSMTKEHMAEELGISKKSVLNFLDKLIELGFIEKNDVSKYLRTTLKWHEVYFTDGVKIAPLESVKIALEDGVKIAPNNNINDIHINSFDVKIEFLKEFNRVKCSSQPTRVLGDKAVKQLNALLKVGYTISDIGQALENAMKTKNHKESNFVYLTPEFITRADKFNIYNAANFSNIAQVGVTSDSDYD